MPARHSSNEVRAKAGATLAYKINNIQTTTHQCRILSTRLIILAYGEVDGGGTATLPTGEVDLWILRI